MEREQVKEKSKAAPDFARRYYAEQQDSKEMRVKLGAAWERFKQVKANLERRLQTVGIMAG